MPLPYYLPFLDGLRALAIVSVVIFHLQSTWLPSGFVGVDIFFVISGFVISASLIKQPSSPFSSGFWYFIKRRFWRLFPALFVCLSTVSLLSVWLLPRSELSWLNQLTGWSALLGLSNFVLAYFDTDSLNPLIEYTLFTPTWSLGVETQFYLLIPFLLWKKIWRRHLLILGLTASIVCSAYLSYNFPSAAYYLLPSRLWELLLGCLVFLSMRHGSTFSASALVWLGRCGALLLFIGIFTTPAYPFPFPNALATTLGTALLIFSLGQPTQSGWIHAVLSLAVLRRLGKLSYSWYLWHWPIFCFFRWHGGLNSTTTQIVAVCLSLIMAYGSYMFIEQRWRRRYL